MLALARFVRKDRRVYDNSHCLYCGVNCGICQGEARACRVSTCLACGTEQCSSNGLGNGQCSVCYVGLLPGWSGSASGQACSYKGCTSFAVARGRGRKRICADHLLHQKPAFHTDVAARRGQAWLLLAASEVPVL